MALALCKEINAMGLILEREEEDKLQGLLLLAFLRTHLPASPRTSRGFIILTKGEGTSSGLVLSLASLLVSWFILPTGLRMA